MTTKLRTLILEQGLQVTDIAEAIDYSLPGASLIVSGDRSCPKYVGCVIADKLGVTTRKIFEIDPRGWYRAKELTK